MTAHDAAISDANRDDAKVIWDYQQMSHELRPCDAGIGLGSHDLGVATLATDLYHAGLFPLLVFTGANSPTTLPGSRAARPCTTPSKPWR